MRILQVHNAYQQYGGEDAVVAAEAKLLDGYGHVVDTLIVSNEVLRNRAAQVRAALTMHDSGASRDLVAERIRAVRPDIVHVHNTFPLITPSVYDAARSAGVPAVQTLHNFRPGCSNALLLRDGVVCEKCWTGSSYWGAVHACYRGSHLLSFLTANSIAYHRRRRTLACKVNQFIALTAFSREKYVQFGLPPERISVKPNFVGDPGAPPDPASRYGALFAGRLSQEKGIDVLIEAWRGLDYPLAVAGDGPLADRVRACGLLNVEVLGRLGREALTAGMRRAAFLVVPSIWYEGLPMTIVEAFANGLPVIASDIGSLGELVRGGGGRVFESGSVPSLRSAVSELRGDPSGLATLSKQARARYEHEFSPAVNHRRLTEIYSLAARGGQDRQRA